MAKRTREDQGLVYSCSLYLRQHWDEIAQRFQSRQNVYVVRFADFALGILILFGEDGRVEFLREVGNELDRVNARIERCRAWADMLKQA
jgi:hypothetical protein